MHYCEYLMDDPEDGLVECSKPTGQKYNGLWLCVEHLELLMRSHQLAKMLSSQARTGSKAALIH